MSDEAVAEKPEEEKDLTQERLDFVLKALMHNHRGQFPNIISARLVASTVIKAVVAFDLKHYVEEEKFWSLEYRDQTEHEVIKSILAAGAERVESWCEEHHEQTAPPSCECIILQARVMGMP